MKTLAQVIVTLWVLIIIGAIVLGFVAPQDTQVNELNRLILRSAH